MSAPPPPQDTPNVDESFDEKKSKKRSFNPAKAVVGGITQGSKAVIGGVNQGTQVVRGGISQVEKGVNNVGGVLNKVPGVSHGVSFFADYRKFMDRGNVIDLAVAVVIGAAFTSIVTSLVTDIITPIIALASGKNLEENFIILKHPETGTGNYTTRASAALSGAVTWNWGNFIQTVINFFIVSACVFMIVKLYQISRNTKTEVTEKKCDYCLKSIPLECVRCPECTTWLDWDACAKVANLERSAAAAVPGVASTPFVDYPAPIGEFQNAQASLGRF
ncbi:hypothetical protein BGZ74_005133 [Mortierella antarctica]|nr:hypothetical protein BGZ74_005133 [Mortierella antarctica]KAG0356397.1 hypothetical protein BG005_004688 [Podila minutissima]